MKVIAIGYERDLFQAESAAALRQVEYAKAIGSIASVVFWAGKEPPPTSPYNISPEVTVYAACARYRPAALWQAFRIVRRLVCDRETVLSAQDPFEAGLVAYVAHLVTGAPFEVQEHGDFYSLPYWRRESLLNRARYVLGLFILRRAHGVRVVSVRIARTLEGRGVRAERIRVLPVFVDTRAFQSAAPDPALASLRPAGGVLMLTMARLVPQKDLTLLVRAFARARAEGANAHLVLIGRGPEKVALEALVACLAPEHITFRDWTDTPAAALRAADVYVLSSRYEGWARVLVEALACGVPVVTTDVGCVGEVVHDRVHGLVVPVGDEAALAEALYTLAQDTKLRETFAAAGPATVAALPGLAESATRMAEGQQALLSHSC